MAGTAFDGDVPTSVTCHSFTHARRFPLVIGKIGGFSLPTPLSPSQIGTLLGSLFLLMITRRWWGVAVPGIGDALVLIVVPIGLTWAVRHLRMEGRSPIKMLFGLASLASAPLHGSVRGQQRWHMVRSQRMCDRIYVAGDTPSPDGLGRGELIEALSSCGPRTDDAMPGTSVAMRWACLDDRSER